MRNRDLNDAVLASHEPCVFFYAKSDLFLVNSFAQLGHPVTTDLVWYKN